MALWSDLYPELLIAAPGAADPLLDRSLARAAQEFYRRTRIWRQWLAPITIAAATRGYTLTLPTGSNVVRLEQAKRNDSDFPILSQRGIDVDLSAKQWREHGLVSNDRRTITLARDLPADDVLYIEASLMPDLDTATGISDDDLDQYGRDIAEGAKALLLAQNRAPWADPAGAAEARARFEIAIGCKAWDSYRGLTNGVPRARPKWC